MNLYSKLAAMTLALGLVAGQQVRADTHYPPACPAPGSGAAGVEAWAAENCGESDCVNSATTCNGEFTIELLHVSGDPLVTFEYEVCQVGGSSGLSHWSIGLGQICLPETYDLDDFIVGAAIWDEEKEEWVPVDWDTGVDPTTQVYGIKFDQGLTGDCSKFAITFDTSKLEEGQTLGVGCVLAATKAGNQDIRPSQNPEQQAPSPGYACIAGPVCVDRPAEEECWADETAWGAGTRYVAKGNWATYSAYVPDSTVILYAGQDYEAGTVYFSAPDGDGNITITVELADGFKFADVEENLKIQGYNVAPTASPNPGGFAHKFSVDPEDSSFTTGPIPLATYYGVHADLLRRIECPEVEE
jgi:hypothetical protein